MGHRTAEQPLSASTLSTMVKSFSDVTKSTDDFAKVTELDGFSFATKIKGGGFEQAFEGAFDGTTKKISQKYNTSYEKFGIEFSDALKPKGENFKESELSVTMPPNDIGDITVSYGVKQVVSSASQEQGFVKLSFEPIDSLKSVFSYNLGPGNVNVELTGLIKKPIDSFGDIDVGAKFTIDPKAPGAPSEVALAAAGSIEDYLFSVSTAEKKGAYPVNIACQTKFDANTEFQIAASDIDFAAFDVKKVGLMAKVNYQTGDNATFIAKLQSNSKIADALFDAYFGSKISMGKGKETVFFQKLGIAQQEVKYRGIGLQVKYEF